MEHGVLAFTIDCRVAATLSAQRRQFSILHLRGHRTPMGAVFVTALVEGRSVEVARTVKSVL
jgi:hypothetical protein